MCTPECIIENVVCIAFDAAAKAWKYVHHYRTNLDNLQTEMRNLEDRVGTIQRQVGEAIGRGRVVENAVLHWQQDAEEMTNHVQQLREQCAARENMQCFTRSCPNIKWRYRLSRQAEQKIADVMRLTQDCHFEEISHARPLLHPELDSCFNKNYVNFDSRMEIFNSIVVALKDSSVNKIGVHGLGGVGKTTIVKEVGKKMQNDGTFNQTPLVTVSNNLDVKEIQSKLADNLYFKFDATGEKGRAKELWDRLNNGNKHLIILDDIWESVDLNAIGIPITDGKTGCKVLLTSRNADLLLNTMEVDRDFRIEELSDDEAWTLFKEKLGNSIESPSELSSLAHEVCEKCKGLPVAINALGAALKSKPLHAWRDALDNLKRYMPTNISGISPSVWASLRVSYNMLQSPDEKSCFLLCCLFAEDIEISVDDLTRQCVARNLLCKKPRTFDEATNNVSTTVGILKSSSLLLNGSNENFVRIHDVIRDVGIWIGHEEKAILVDHGALEWPRDGSLYTSISLRFGKIKELPNGGLMCPQLHTLILDNSELSDLEVPDKFFSGMKKLTVLVLNRMRMKRLPSSLVELTELRMLYLNECKLEDIAILGDLKTTLEVLSLRGSNIYALPREIAQLTSLRVLDLQDCEYLKVIPQGVISNLTGLEELYFPKAFQEWEETTDKKRDTSNNNNVSLEELRLLLGTTKLTTLRIRIPNVMLLPNESLKRFQIVVCARVGAHNCFYGFQKYSKALGLHEITFRNELIPFVDKAEVLDLRQTEALEKALHGRRVGNERFNKLTWLLISDCKIKYLFSESTTRGLIHLEKLCVRGCGIMEEIVRFEGQNDDAERRSEVKFSKLKELELYNLPNLISFYAKKEKMETTNESSSTRAQPLFNEKVIFPVLEKLEIGELGNIVEIWDKQSPLVHENAESFSQLVTLEVKSCAKLINLVPSNVLRRLLRNLQDLNVRSCPNMESIVFENGKEEEATDDSTLVIIPQLRTLKIHNMENLKSFYSSSKRSNAQSLFNHQVIFPVLEKLDIGELGNIVEIWDKQSPLVHENAESFSQLVTLEVKSCAKLINLVPSNVRRRLLRNLQELNVQSCPNLESIVLGNGKEEEEEATSDSTVVILPQLKTLVISNMENFKSFYSSSKRSNAQSLFNHQVIFPVLEQLKVDGLGNIVEIWDKQSLLVHENRESFSKLEDVIVKYCAKLMNLVPSNILPQLHNLKIRSCPDIESIVYENGKEEEKVSGDSTLVIISQLKILTIENMKNLKSFYSSSMRSNAQSLFNHQVIFPVLMKLNVNGLGNIVEIWDKQSLLVHKNRVSFSKLEDVIVEDCAKLMNLVPSNILPQLHNLKVKSCPDTESIVYENGKEEEKASGDSTLVIISQLRILTIEKMENLKSFYSSSIRSNAQSLFNHQVIFPILKELNVNGLHNIAEIWDKQSLLVCENGESFSKLKDVRVEDCAKLMNLVPSSILPQLQHLQVRSCPDIESIVCENGKEEEKVSSELRGLIIANMENLKSFYSSSMRSNAQSLFNHQVIFPVLKQLIIYGLCNIVEIWDKQSLSGHENAESFSKLESVSVKNCAKLMNLLPSNILPRLQNLQDLRACDCPNLESIVFENRKEEEAADDSTLVIIPQLWRLDIWGMEKLKSFYSSSKISNAQSLFNHQVIFPVLKRLDINRLHNIVEIWDKQSLLGHENAESFYKLEYVQVNNCAKLMNLLPSNILPRLQNLEELRAWNCPNLESIVFENRKEEEAADDSTLVIIPQLRNLTISTMEKLKSFYSSSKRSNAQSLFNHQVIFPALETLCVWMVPNITEIWDKQPLSKPKKETESFCKLQWVDVYDCEQLVYLFPSYMLPHLHNLQTLEIRYCKELEVIVSRELKEKEAANNDVIVQNVFPQLQNVKLKGLKKLTSFCSGTQVVFSNKDAFPVLERIRLDKNLEFLRNRTSTEKEAIEECGTSGKENDHNGEED